MWEIKGQVNLRETLQFWFSPAPPPSNKTLCPTLGEQICENQVHRDHWTFFVSSCRTGVGTEFWLYLWWTTSLVNNDLVSDQRPILLIRWLETFGNAGKLHICGTTSHNVFLGEAGLFPKPQAYTQYQYFQNTRPLDSNVKLTEGFKNVETVHSLCAKWQCFNNSWLLTQQQRQNLWATKQHAGRCGDITTQ